MPTESITFYPELKSTVEKILAKAIDPSRKPILQSLIDYVQAKVKEGTEVQLNFICTHNSRRSQFSQIWAQLAAEYYGVSCKCYSGGVEVTAFNERAVASIERSGFKIEKEGQQNPVYRVYAQENEPMLLCFSKLYDDPINQAKHFAAVMTCSDADENCPFIPGTEKRIPLRYEDPKAYDGTPLEAKMYDQRSRQIASELFYVFSKIQISLP